MTRFSANLGFLWKELPLPAAIRAAKAAGFEAVECHWPYAVPASEIRAVLHEIGLPMLGLNTALGDPVKGDRGLSAVPSRQTEARDAIAQAVSYGAAIGCNHVHVMAGQAEGDAAKAVFVENLRYASDMAAQHDMKVVIEPLNTFDAPGYFLNTLEHAAHSLTTVSRTNCQLMFDCYHVARTEGSAQVPALLQRYLPIIGHIQFAGVPDRGNPEQGTLDYREIFQRIAHLGYTAPLGAEYEPDGATEASLGWMKSMRGSSLGRLSGGISGG